jgi:hypothetical protein
MGGGEQRRGHGTGRASEQIADDVIRLMAPHSSSDPNGIFCAPAATISPTVARMKLVVAAAAAMNTHFS